MKEQKKSSWGAVLVSFLKEFLLNSFEAPGHLYYDENLTNDHILLSSKTGIIEQLV